MSEQEPRTYYRSVSLGRGQEVSDQEFYAFAEGLLPQIVDPETFDRLNGILDREPWRLEVALYRNLLESEEVLEESQALRTDLASISKPDSRTGSLEPPITRSMGPSPKQVLQELLLRVRAVLAPSHTFAEAGATRGEPGDTPSLFEAEIEKVEEAMGLKGEGLTLVRLRSCFTELARQNQHLQAEFGNVKEMLKEMERELSTLVDEHD